MRQDYERLFTHAERREPPVGLLGTIMRRIGEERRRAALVRLACFGTLALAALLAFIPAWGELRAELAQTGFSQFVSLLFSDANVVIAYWQDFTLSLAESFPVVGTVAVLGSAFTFLYSLRFLTRDAGTVFHRSNLASALH